jgi:uncharacterized protein (DUF2336 family)
MTTTLSHEDVDRLLTERSPEARAALAGKVAVSLTEPGLTLGEITLAQDIVRMLARDVEARVRGSIAQALRDSRHLPRDVALRLAEDIDSVALPVLAESLVLTDADLVGLIRHGTDAKQETIASRPNLGELVSDALITHAAEPAVATLMSNPTAQIGDASFDQAVTRFAGSDRVKRAIVLRDTLPPAVAERLVMLVTRELQQHLVRVHALPPGIASDIVLRSRESAIIRLSMGASEDELVRMVSQMQRSDRLTPSLLLRALCTGDIAFFEAAMAVKGDVPLANAQILIHERGRRGLTALYRKSKMPASLFEAVRMAIEIVDETGFDGNPRDLERYRGRVLTRILTWTESLDPSDADYLVEKLGDLLVPDGVSESVPVGEG